MILFPRLPMPTVAPSVGMDPLGMESMRQVNKPDPELSKAEEAALKEHLGELQSFAETVNQAKAVESVPVLGDVASMALPIPANEAPGGLMPLNVPGSFEARGYLDLDGNATKAGEDYLLMQESGLLDELGMLTPKGKAFAADEDPRLQSLDDYIARDKFGLNAKPDVSFGDALAGVGGFVGDAVKGGWRVLKSSPANVPGMIELFASDTEDMAESVIANQAFAEGALESPALLGSGGAEILSKAAAVMTGDDVAFYEAKQRGDSFKRDLDDMEAADLYGNLIESKAAVDAMAQARGVAISKLGDERAAEIESQGEAAGGLFGDPSNLATMGIGAAVGAGAKAPLMARIGVKAERATQAALAAEDAAAALAKTRAVADKAQRAAAIAAKQAENLRGIQSPMAGVIEAQAGRFAATNIDESAKLPLLEEKAKAAALLSARMAEEAGGAPQVLAAIESARAVGRSLRAAPAKAIAPLVESIGETVIKVDNALWGTAEKLGFTKETIGGLRGAAAAMGATTGGFGAIPAVLAAGPVIRGVGNFTRVLGQELMQARGTTPFWQRVAQNSAISPLGRNVAHAIDNATLSGKVFAPIRLAGAAAKGTAAAAPLDIAFEIIAEGGDMSPSTLKQGLAESLVFAGPAAVGGALVRGDVNTLRAKAAGDEINLRKRLDPDSLAGFARMPKGVRKNLSIYSGAFPTLDFRVVDDGPNSYDRRSNTITVNRNSPDPLAGIVAHEVSHHLQVKAQAEEGIRAMLVGDVGTGGLLRAADGTLDPSFQMAMDEYNARLEAIDAPPLSVEDFAIEYFTEATVNDLLDATESGDIQRAAGRSDLERMVRDISRRLVAKAPILQNLFYNLGGATDAKGGMVQGNGLLAAGIRELPGARAMLRKMADEAAGRGMEKIAPNKDGEAVKIPAEAIKNNKALADSFFGVLKTDAAGNVILGADGLPEYIDKATDDIRSSAGLILAERQRQKIERGDLLPEGELAPTEDGGMQGTHVPNNLINEAGSQAKFNRRQIATWRMLNESSKAWDGATFNVIYQAAMRTNKAGKKIGAGLAATFREVVPVGVSTTKAGNVLIHFFSVTQFVENIRKRAKTALGKALYKGDENAIREDAEAVMKLHREGKTSDAYFAAKYGDIEGIKRKNFINTVFGLMTKEQRNINPLFESEKVMNEGVYKTYRLDRINKTTRLQGRTPMPFSYDSVKANLFPNGNE